MEQRLPAVFLSSTFFDLRQVRADLADFVEGQLGYRLLASEYVAFPVEPTVDAVENCRRRVETDADAFVLVIGGRYGNVPDGGPHSVTNIEYLTARAKRIPIFAFVAKDVLALVPVWQANPEADFSKVVDNTRLFEFIREVRENHRVWTFPFETAQEIVRALRVQLAYQMCHGLRVLAALGEDDKSITGLTGPAFRTVVEKPRGWPGLLLAQLTDDEVAACSDLRRDHHAQLAIGVGELVSRGNRRAAKLQAGEARRG